MNPDTERIAGYDVTRLDPVECVNLVSAWLSEGPGEGGRGRYFVCVNPHSLEKARADQEFTDAISDADLVIPDGIGVVLASRLAGGQIRQRVTGMMLFRGVCEMLNRRGGSVYFLGSTDQVLDRIVRRFADDYPRLRIVGACSPPFASTIPPDDDARIVESINRAEPDVVWVGMTAPKQEKWIHRHRHDVRARLLGPIGAAFDFYAGTVKYPSPWFRDHGLEWLPRLLRQPGRLWRRSLVSAPKFLGRALLDAGSRRNRR
jgi:N-acetylglucosaminyldiphosphoundecaprenol N-acetyl-beta-D-mannosaminyltransferase